MISPDEKLIFLVGIILSGTVSHTRYYTAGEIAADVEQALRFALEIVKQVQEAKK